MDLIEKNVTGEKLSERLKMNRKRSLLVPVVAKKKKNITTDLRQRAKNIVPLSAEIKVK
ncbi:1767_t:CDS:2, partial [Racocetra persica]